MNLKNATIWVIAGTSYTILLKLAHFVLPVMFENDQIFLFSKILMLLVFLGQIFFLGYFYRDYLQPEQKQLRLVTLLCFILPVFNLIFRLKGLFQISPDLRLSAFEISPDLFSALGSSPLFRYFIPLLGGVILLWFFITFYNELKQTTQQKLTRAVFWMIILAAANLFKSFITFATYLLHEQPGDLFTILVKMSIMAVPLFLFGTILTIYFYVTFYQSLE